MAYYIGIDIGGTGIKAGLLDENLRILQQRSIPTLSQPGANDNEKVTNAVEKLMRELCEAEGIGLAQVLAAGVGCPGTVDNVLGVVEYANNIDLLDLYLRREIKNRTGINLAMGNDADVAALGEHVTGGSSGHDSSLMITLGTGVGGGFVIDNHIYTGFNSRGAEFGHMVVEKGGALCTCGRRGCLEAYASATGLIRMTRESMEKNPDTLMWKLCEGKLENVNGKTAFDAAEQGDKSGKDTVDCYIGYLATGIANYINMLHPEIICIGGGISRSGDDLLIPLKKKAYEKVFGGASEKTTRIVLAKLGSDAGVVGAAVLGRQQMQELQMQQKIRLASVGTGWIVDAFLDGLLLVEGIEHTAVYSRSEKTAAEFMGRRQTLQTAHINAYTDLEALAKSPDIDAVYIASPNSLHFSQSMLFLENKKHVICEKSVTVCREDASALYKAAEENGVVFMEAIMLLYMPAFETLKKAMEEIAPVRMARFDFQQYSSKYQEYLEGEQPNIFNPKMSAGCLMDIGVYCVYPAVALFGEPDTIHASAILLENGADAAGAAVFSYKDGPVVTLTHSKVGQGIVGSEIVGERGTITIGSIGKLDDIELHTLDGKRQTLFSESEKAEKMAAEAKGFVRFIRDAQGSREEYKRNALLCEQVSGVMRQMRRQCEIHFPQDRD